MDFGVDNEAERYRKTTRDFIDSITGATWRSWGEAMHASESDYWFPWTREAQARLAEAGLVGVGWPPPAGLGLPMTVEHVINEELAYAGIPARQFNAVGEMILRYGSEQLIAEHLPRIPNGEVRYADGFSEPEAGSDLFALRTTAVREHESYRIRGTKIWTSYAHVAQYLLVLARTDPKAQRHHGLSLILVPTDSPGLAINPVRVAAGWRLNICTFDDVAVPVANRLGEEGDAIEILEARLAQERSISFGGVQARLMLARLVHRLGALGHQLPDTDLAELGRLLTDLEAERLMEFAVAAQAARGEVDTAAASRAKVFGSELAQRAAEWFLAVANELRQAYDLDDADPLVTDIARFARSAVTLTLAGGTSEMQRNAIATRGLGLPRSR